jgi:hypothetical protein
MELLAIKSKGKMKGLQRIQGLVPLRHLSLDLDVCCLQRCFRVGLGYSDEELSLEETIFLDARDIIGSKD